MAGSVYLRRVNAINRNQQTDDVQRGMQIGQEIGKMMGGLSEAVKGYQKDQLANKLMNQQSISSQPGAGQTQDLGTLPSDTGDGSGGGGASDDQLQQAMAASRLSSPSGQSQDLGQLPPDEPMTPDPSGQQVMPGPGVSDDQLQQAMAAARIGGGPTVGAASPVSPPGGPQPATVGGQPPSGGTPAAGDNWNLSGFSGGTGPGTVGGLLHTGGVQELELQKEMLAMQGTRAQQVNAQQEAALKLADARAKASGTGIYALDAATKRLALAKAQRDLLSSRTTKPDKNASPTDFNGEPVDNQAQLTNFVDGVHGKGVTAGLVSMASTGNETATDAQGNPVTDANGNPIIDPVTKQPKVASIVPVTIGKKTTNLPLGIAQTAIKQQNALLNKQHQPLLRVPGENQSLGSKENPYPVKNKLDALSRASGTWVISPTGQVAQVP